jgi:excinuclease UvrABC nuclease subunit
LPPHGEAESIGRRRAAAATEAPITELRLPHTDPGLRLLVELRNEAHRFGNAQHAKMRDKAMRLSVLDTIPGLGAAKRAALLKHFGSVKRLREASEAELAEVSGIGPKLAETLRRYLDRDAELEDGKAILRREMRIRRLGQNSVKTEG